MPFLVALDIKINDFRSFHLQCPKMLFLNICNNNDDDDGNNNCVITKL